MIRTIGWLIKITLFSVLILVLGNWVKWGGKTVSDQVKTQLSHAERSEIAGSLKRWTGGVTEDARKGARKAATAVTNRLTSTETNDGATQHVAPQKEKRRAETVPPQERIQSSERQKLRALIQELNSSTSADRRTH